MRSTKVFIFALAFVACAGSCLAQVAYTSWSLVAGARDAAIVSDRDYEAPDGIQRSFHCVASSDRIQIRHYQGLMDDTEAQIAASERPGFVRRQRVCDARCIAELKAAYPDDHGAALAKLYPKKFSQKDVAWKRAKGVLVAALDDPAQFGDSGKAEIKKTKTHNRAILSRFTEICRLP